MVGTAAMGDVTMVLQPGAPAPILLPTCQTPAPRSARHMLLINATSFPFQVTGKNVLALALLQKLGGLREGARYQNPLG